jgi:hypothetical protein
MLPTPVALVPFSTGRIETRELLHVAAALQTQVIRDLSPLWGISGLVSAFEALRDVPPGYNPLVIVGVDDLSGNQHGFHFAADGQPIGLIEYGDGWSVWASHELIEMLCDPWGNRTVTGPSLQADQGEVDYLVEVCDPCQRGTYEINGVPVSDFVTPQYYHPINIDGARYSFMGTVKQPRQLLEGGYISWLTRPPDDQIWQARAQQAANGELREPEIEQYEGVATVFSRAWVDSHPVAGRYARAAGEPAPKTTPYVPDESSAEQYGKALKAEVTRILGMFKSMQAPHPSSTVESLQAQPPSPTVQEIIELLKGLAKDGDPIRDEFARDPGSTLAKYRIAKPIGLSTPLAKLPSAEQYKLVLDKLQQVGLGPYFGDPDLANLLATLGTLGTLGTLD